MLIQSMENGTSVVDSMGQQGKTARVRPRVTRYRYLFLAGTVGGAALLLLTLHGGPELMLLRESPRRARPARVDSPFTIDTDGCTIPDLKPFDENIKQFITTPVVGSCRNSNFSVLQSNASHIWVKREFLRDIDGDADNVSCCYKPFYRPSSVNDVASDKVDNRIEYQPCIYFSKIIEVKNEFVRVTCEYELPNREYGSHDQFFVFAQEKKVMERVLIEDVKPQSKPSYNVLILGLDAVSRLNFHRTMPKTESFLRKKGALELMGYNKVGDNTFPNLTPLLLGIRDTELPKTCWPHAKATFDNCPFVWECFKDVGYYTALGEDSAKLGTFNFERMGFLGTPTDYYLHPFVYEAERNAGNNMDFNSFLCMGHKYFYQVLLDYVEELTRVLKSSRLFGFFWEVTMSHDYLNYPMFMDNSYERFLTSLDSARYLDETIVIFLSDHGIRWGEIRATTQGRLEERLPLVYILTPPSFRGNYSLAYKNLITNIGRLTTPFDVHATLVDLASMEAIKDENIKLRSQKAYGHDRSISLFLPVPKNRTCEMADIDEHWCTCHKEVKTGTYSGEAHVAATFLVRKLNELVADHAQCARLRLAEIVEARELVAGVPEENEVGWREHLVVVRTEPGGGVFEATLRAHAHGLALAGAISRLNLYGEQSHCIHHYRLKLYCYCQ